jgi:hypothetical protein
MGAVLTTLAVLVCFLISGCQQTETSLAAPQDPGDAWGHVPGAPAGAITGFDPVLPDRDLAPGDEILLGVDFRRGDERKIWFVSVTIAGFDTAGEGGRPPMMDRQFRTGPDTFTLFQSRRWLLEINAWDGEGRAFGGRREAFPADLLRRGFLEACQAVRRYRTVRREGDRAPAKAVNAVMGGAVTLFSVLELVQRIPQLDAILWEVVEKPSPLAVLLEGGLRVNVKPGFDRATRASPPPSLPIAETAWSFPVDLKVNGTTALRCRLLVTDPHAPLHLAGGVLALAARHPTDAARRLRIRVVAARRTTRERTAAAR